MGWQRLRRAGWALHRDGGVLAAGEFRRDPGHCAPAVYGGWGARLGAAAGGSIRACWVFMELGLVTPAWASACARMWGPRGGVWRWCFGTALRGF